MSEVYTQSPLVQNADEEAPIDWRDVPCKLWTGAKSGNGYGARKIGKKVRPVHRHAWEEANGPIPNGLFVCHHCDTPLCYELAHLFLGTVRDNALDMVAKGRGYLGDHSGRAERTHCRHGHEYTPENTFLRKEGVRVCRECMRISHQKESEKRLTDPDYRERYLLRTHENYLRRRGKMPSP